MRAIAAEVGIADARANMLPSQKAEVVRSLVAAGARVLMVGDGTNDAPAMSRPCDIGHPPALGSA